ncbi:hypothetical protein KCU90_g2913, partial [Aureobasidium melanogenum]
MTKPVRRTPSGAIGDEGPLDAGPKFFQPGVERGNQRRALRFPFACVAAFETEAKNSGVAFEQIDVGRYFAQAFREPVKDVLAGVELAESLDLQRVRFPTGPVFYRRAAQYRFVKQPALGILGVLPNVGGITSLFKRGGKGSD